MAPDVEHWIRATAEAMLAQADELVEASAAAIAATVRELSADPLLADETRASTRANVERWLTATARHPEAPVPSDVPPEALDLARTLVRRGLDTGLLLRAYRAGEDVAWRAWMAAAAGVVPSVGDLVAVLDETSARMRAYVDGVVEGVLEAAEREREQLTGGAATARAQTIRLLLDGAPVETDVASRRLDYELRRRHTALVLWADPPREEQGALETTATALARAAGAHRPLLLPASTSSLWAWVGTARDPDLGGLRAALDAAPAHVRVTVGPTRGGPTGFRRSHAGALAAHRLVAAHAGGPRWTTYADVEPVALVAHDPAAAADFVRSVLGGLAADDPATAELRETVRTFLAEGEHGPRTAARLGTHRNTVLHRVTRAEALLGHPIAARRLAVALALEVAHRLGPRVL